MNNKLAWSRLDYAIFSVVIVALIGEFFWLIDVPFFWDAKSKALRANWIYSNHFSNIIVPTQLNSGHPPLWIASLALFWTVLGKSLWAARLLLLVVNIGVVYQLYALFLKLRDVSVPKWIFLLLCIEPTFLAQTTSLNNDMLLLFFVLFSCNALLSGRWKWYAVALTGLVLSNLRGLYFTVALVIIHIWLHRQSYWIASRKMWWAYACAISVFIGFAVYQYAELGWAIISENKGFSEHRKAVGWKRIIKNFLLYGKSFLEFGRFILWVPLFIFLPKFLRKGTAAIPTSICLNFGLLVVFGTILLLGSVPFSNPISPRYYMSCYLLLGILATSLIFHQWHTSEAIGRKKWLKKGLIILIALCFVSGHYWIYPPTYSQAWDSSLAYLNYYEPKQKMLTYLKKEQIPQKEIGSHLPLMNYKLNLQDAPDIPYEFVNVNFDTNQYILFSNIENASTDKEINLLQTEWNEVVTFSKNGVFLTLYKRP